MGTEALVQYHSIHEAAWTKLARAANDPASLLRLMAVATVAPDGRPSNRTLVLRGADRGSGTVWFHTDLRSPKVGHLRTRPFVSALGYDPQDRVQIRLDGTVTLHDDDALAERHWQQVSMAVRRSYASTHGPGESIGHADPRLQVMRAQQELGDMERGRRNFLVIEVSTEAIDWLQIGATRQVRAILRASTGWMAEAVVP